MDISFIVERLNMPPFNKRLDTMTEFDSMSSLELLELMCEIITAIDPGQKSIHKEANDFRVKRIIQFLTVTKFNIPEDQFEDFQDLLMSGDKKFLHKVIHWSLKKLDQMQKQSSISILKMPVNFFVDLLI
jgi:hypothetical protein